MSAISEWVAPRAPVLRAIALGFGSWPVAAGAAWVLWPDVTPIEAPVDRALLALQLAAIPAVVLQLMLQSLWRLLDTNKAEDPLAGAESRRWKINARVFQNTIEQTLLFVPVLVALAIRLPPELTRVLPILVALWTAGRLMFWAGYHVALHWRAPGMDWTTATCTAALLLLVWTLF